MFAKLVEDNDDRISISFLGYGLAAPVQNKLKLWVVVAVVM